MFFELSARKLSGPHTTGKKYSTLSRTLSLALRELCSPKFANGVTPLDRRIRIERTQTLVDEMDRHVLHRRDGTPGVHTYLAAAVVVRRTPRLLWQVPLVVPLEVVPVPQPAQGRRHHRQTGSSLITSSSPSTGHPGQGSWAHASTRDRPRPHHLLVIIHKSSRDLIDRTPTPGND